MKIRTSLGAGLAVAAVATTVIGVGAPALASVADGSWNTMVGGYGAAVAGMATSADGTTAYVAVDQTSQSASALVPVDLSTGVAGTATAISASSFVAAPAVSGGVVAVAGFDSTNNSYAPTAWTVNGTNAPQSIPLTNPNANYVSVSDLAATPAGFIALGTSDNCLETWTWAPTDTSATAGTPVCSSSLSYSPERVAVQPGTGTEYAVVLVDDSSNNASQQLLNLTDPTVAPVTLPADLGNALSMMVSSTGIVYVAGQSADGSDTRIATVDPTNPAAMTDRDTGLYPSSPSQLSLVGNQLWVGSWNGIGVLSATGTTSYTTAAPAPTLNTDDGPALNFATTAGADYLLLPADSAYLGQTSNAAPGVLKVVAPATPAAKVTISGTRATLSWSNTTGGGTSVTSATVTTTDTTTDTVRTPVRTGNVGSVVVGSLVPGHSYSFAVTQSNGFIASAADTVTVKVPLPATAKPSKVAVVGTLQVGRKLTISTTGSWASGATLSYAWYAGTRKVGTAASYTLKAADAGTKVKVAVTGVVSGHTPSTVTSTAVGPVTKPVYKVTQKPTITGTPAVGKTLTAHIAGLPKGATVKYQWAETTGQSGGPIGNPTTSTTLRLTAQERGEHIEVIALVSVPGYSTGSAMSAITAAVK